MRLPGGIVKHTIKYRGPKLRRKGWAWQSSVLECYYSRGNGGKQGENYCNSPEKGLHSPAAGGGEPKEDPSGSWEETREGVISGAQRTFSSRKVHTLPYLLQSPAKMLSPPQLPLVSLGGLICHVLFLCHNNYHV